MNQEEVEVTLVEGVPIEVVEITTEAEEAGDVAVVEERILKI
jgi:hypothetical protein